MILEKIKKNKNLSLFLILVTALCLTYWFEERGNQKLELIDTKTHSILDATDLGNLKSVKGLKIDFEVVGKSYFARENHLPLSEVRMDEFFKILSGLKVKTFLKDEDVAKVGRSFYVEDDGLKMTFSFEHGEMSFTLGKKLPYDQTFYMEIEKTGKKQIVIASDESPDPGVYQNDKDYQRSEAKYKRLQMIFMLTNLYFYDTRIFKDMYADAEKIHFTEVAISTFRNKKFKVNFKDTKTAPEPPKSIDYFEENWISFHRAITHLEAKQAIAPYEPSALGEILSFFEIVDREGRKIELQLYKKFGESNGYFLTSSLDKVLYVLKPDDARYFFVNVQDFWKKSIGPKSKEYLINVTFFDSTTEKIKITDKELFKAEAAFANSKLKPRTLEFKKLVDFIKMEGDHVSELTEKPTEILKKNLMRVSFDNKTLSVILEENDAILVDLEARIKIHHYVGAKVPFSLKKADYFE